MLLVKARLCWTDTIKTNLSTISFEDVDWLHVAEVAALGSGSVNMAMKFHFPRGNGGDCITRS